MKRPARSLLDAVLLMHNNLILEWCRKNENNLIVQRAAESGRAVMLSGSLAIDRCLNVDT
jgi:hypothetical protein